jgi:hypothetical protein
LNKNDFFYFAQFPLNFGWFVELPDRLSKAAAHENHKTLSFPPGRFILWLFPDQLGRIFVSLSPRNTG